MHDIKMLNIFMEIVIAGGAERWIKKRFNNTQYKTLSSLAASVWPLIRWNAPFVQCSIVNCIVWLLFFGFQSEAFIPNGTERNRMNIVLYTFFIMYTYVCVFLRKQMYEN